MGKPQTYIVHVCNIDGWMVLSNTMIPSHQQALAQFLLSLETNGQNGRHQMNQALKAQTSICGTPLPSSIVLSTPSNLNHELSWLIIVYASWSAHILRDV